MKSLSAVIGSVIAIATILIAANPVLAGLDPASSPSGPYFPTDRYNPEIPRPSDYLGFPLGSKPAGYAQVAGYLKLLAESSEKAQLYEYGETYEGYTLYYVLATSEKNMSRISSIKKGHELISDPRKLKSKGEADKLFDDLPAVVWVGYSIHGDELSSTDAALAVAYQLVAGTDESTENLLESLVILIDPLQNPDGRERFLAQIKQFSSNIPSYDVQSMQHTGVWPWGRGNHYLIDLNRDMITAVHPETRGKIAVCLEWHPQVMIDSHEMGPLDSYLFSPGRDPFNPYMLKNIREWWDIFAADQAKAFDNYGWRYYTRAWSDEWYPGYTSEWGIFLGMIGILYEQAGVSGLAAKQKTGAILTYSESVHHHLVSSMANLETAAERRQQLLKDYFDHRRQAVENKENSIGASFIIDPSQNRFRVDRLIETMILQGIEVRRAESGFEIGGLYNEHGKVSARRFPAGTYIIDFSQPSRYLIQVLLDYDIHMTNETLFKERRYLEKGWGSRMYEVMAWSLPLAFGLDSYVTDGKLKVNSSPVTEIERRSAKITNENPLFGYMVEYSDDGATYLLADALDGKLKTRIATRPVTVDGYSFGPGSILFTVKENPDSLAEMLQEYSEKYGVDVIGINTALASEGPDLGGSRFRLLIEPKVAILAGQPIDFSDYGSLWHMIDYELGLRLALIDVSRMGRVDLSKYNVLIMPSIWGDVGMLKSVIGEGGIANLKGWVEDGGTLIAMDQAAVFCADTTVGLSQVRLKRQALEKLDEYDYALLCEQSANKIVIDSLQIWHGIESGKKEAEEEDKKKPGKEELKRIDEFARKFSPQGPILSCAIDTTQWLSFGLGESLPVMVYTQNAYLSKPPIQTVARFRDEKNIRLSGLVWPEARQRWGNTAYCTREGKGKGQVILFASHPNLRSFFHGSKRLLVNALLLGPGLGARWSVPY